MRKIILAIGLLFISVLWSTLPRVSTNANESIENQSKLSDKNIVFLGDSLTAKNGTKKYIDIIAQETGANCYNFGQNESTIAENNNAKYGAFVDRYKDIIKEYPRDYFDIIVIFGGTNDYAMNVPIGDFSTDRKTFIGALGETIYNMQAMYPKAKIVLMTPLIATYGDNVFDYTKNATGALLGDYRKAIRDISELYGCIIYDTNKYSGLNPNNGYMFEKYYSNKGDGVHPNEDGHKRIAIPLINLLNGLF
ncbi:MAG: hypothetical protein K0S61_103 [Anaerocolumna sp.]|jgi:lysophospholipase L1-like esterase|nr:hypothetical protein [Anaerocolumna sp.]